MNQLLLVLAVALTVGAIVFGIIALLSGDDEGLSPAEPDGRAVPLPANRPLIEPDVADVKFDTAWRGYRMAQVDAALRRIAYDIGYKDELVKVLRAEIDALREGRFPDAEVLRRAREAAVANVVAPAADAPATDEPVEDPHDADSDPFASEPADSESADREPADPGPADREPADRDLADPGPADPGPADPGPGDTDGEGGDEVAGGSNETTIATGKR